MVYLKKKENSSQNKTKENNNKISAIDDNDDSKRPIDYLEYRVKRKESERASERKENGKFVFS